ncbi:N-acetyltransferase [Ketobacter sp. MCCC 1A13808]|uniref:GNAT family N-acetyltransferase n=1 Tax=Ketobacter sp. MCCC 1A13808 TaxID=2602738 RepID=UPI000F2A9B9D|nr:GNAT family N-acetyltransferase [Ketobacter sp. MCCC 1A13808]MVF13296.1 N-acetyltransferase [Ketobacter sp. MCCC 1A13808]RLP54284.1 MAG: N-acetyltransferase [Ketobacter sp.]
MLWRRIINTSDGFTVEHQPELARFVVNLGSEQAVMTYQLLDEGKIDFNHTYVPKSARGTGLADILVNEGLVWASTKGFDIQASCWFVRGKLN